MLDDHTQMPTEVHIIKFGGIAAEVARIAARSGMRGIAWNCSPKSAPGVRFVDIDTAGCQSQGL